MNKIFTTNMDFNIYYDTKDSGLLITSEYEQKQKQMDMGMLPHTEYQKVSVSDLNSYRLNGVALEKVGNDYFQEIKGIFSMCDLEYIAFHESKVDLSDAILNAQHLFIGEKSNIILANKNFKNLEEITFLSVKSFKGSVVDEFETVKKLVVWDSLKTFSLPEKFPNLEELTVNKGGILELDLRT